MVEILCLVVYVDLQHLLIINSARLKYQPKLWFGVPHETVDTYRSCIRRN